MTIDGFTSDIDKRLDRVLSVNENICNAARKNKMPWLHVFRPIAPVFGTVAVLALFVAWAVAGVAMVVVRICEWPSCVPVDGAFRAAMRWRRGASIEGAAPVYKAPKSSGDTEGEP